MLQFMGSQRAGHGSELNRTELNLLNLQSLTQFEKFSIIISSNILSASICLFYFFFSDSIDMKIICFDYCPTGF